MVKEEELRPYRGSGAGDKLHTSRFAYRSNTPYDRPQTGCHAPAAVRATMTTVDSRRSDITWFSRIVDPASRLITQSVVKWFSSVFKKNHPALSSTTDDVEEMDATVIPDSALYPLNAKLQDDRYVAGIRSWDLHPSLCYRNRVKSDVVDRIFHRRSRLYSRHRVTACSETVAGFPLFVKTIIGSSLCLHAQDSDSVF
jgi:hypothetical protein